MSEELVRKIISEKGEEHYIADSRLPDISPADDGKLLAVAGESVAFADADASLSTTSKRPAQNKVITVELAKKASATAVNAHIADHDNPHEVTKAQVGLGNVDNKSAATIKTEFTGAVAEGNTGFVLGADVYAHTSAVDNPHSVTKAQVGLSEVDNKSEATIKADFTGEIAEGNAGFAVAGDVYSHTSAMNNPHGVTKAQVGLGNVDDKSVATIKAEFTGVIADGNTGFVTGGDVYGHTSATNNPHNVTKAQVGLGNVDNTADANKPVSVQAQIAIDAKVDKEVGKGLSESDYTGLEKSKLSGIAAGAQVNVLEGVKVNGSDLTIVNKKVDIDLSSFITKNVGDLVNYYTKGDTYTKAEVTALLNAIKTIQLLVVEELPASGESNIIYLVRHSHGAGDGYDEYVWVASSASYEKIGNTDIDLSPYSTTEQMNAAIASALTAYYTKAELDAALALKAAASALADHVGDTSNPHGVTKEQLGLGSVDNTSDLNKPISLATQAALDTKQPMLVSGTDIRTINGQSVLGSGDIALPVDAETSATSEHPLQNKVITAELALKASQADFAAHVGDTANPHGVTAAQVGLGNVDNKSAATLKTEFTGVIAEGNTGFAVAGDVYDHTSSLSNPHGVTKAQVGLSEVDNKSEADIKADFTGAIVVGNTGFVTGGDVYDHTSATNNPHGVTKAQVGLGDVDNKSEATIKADFTGAIADGDDGFVLGADVYAHTSAVNNPHGVTKAQVGLGNVDNTADVDKPISTFVQAALDTKQNTLVSGANIKTINGASILGSGDYEIEIPEVTVDDAMSATSENPVQNKVITAALADKVDVVSGKGLSANDYTDAEKQKLAGIAAGAQVNTITSVAGRTGAIVLSSSDVGLGNVDNTSDLDKPISTAVQEALDEKVDAVEGKGLSSNDYTDAEKTKLANIEAGAQVNVVTSVAGKTGDVTLAKGDVGLGNVDNTSDVDKPISTAMQAALDEKVDAVEGKGLSANDFTDAYKDDVDANITARHAHANKSILDDIEAAYTTAEQTKLAGIEAGAEVNTVDSVAGKTGDVTLVKGDVGLGNVDNTADLDKPVSTATQTALDAKVDVVSGKGLSANDFTDAYKDDVDANTTARHAHSNKAILDAITASYTAAEQTKLGGIEAGAQVNTVNKVNNKTGNVTITKEDLGLENVENKSTATIKSEFTGSVSAGDTGFVTGGAVKTYVDTALDNLPEPMIFKGTLGTGGTITSLPAAASANEGFTYKVITAGTYASQSAKVGDVFVSNGSAWVIIPAGDTDSDTWREVKVNGISLLGSGVSTGAVNFKSGANVTVSGSGNDITISSSYTDTNQTIKGNGTAFSANDAVNIVGGGATTVAADTTNKKITISTPAVTDTNQTVQGNGIAFGADAVVNIVGGGATTVTADTTNNKITINTPAVTDTNQKVKAGSVTFGADDTVNFEGGGIVSVTGDATNDKITISASHQSIKTLDTTATTAQSTSASEAISGSGKVTLHKVAKTGTYSDLIGTPSFATVATSGSYNDLSNKPTIPAAQVNANWNATSGVAQILNKPTLATVATSGDYDDLTNKPTIPAAQVSSDWTATSGVAQILHKPSLATVATSGSYNDLSNKPTIPSVDSAMSATSTNPVQNKVVNAAINAASTKASKVVVNGTEYTATFDSTTGVLSLD